MTDTLEVRLLRWSDNSNGGQTVTFLLPESEVHPFKGLRFGKTGERFAMALAHIEDDETKADHVFPDGYVEGSKPELSEGRKCVKMAHALCRDPQFDDWVIARCKAAGKWPSIYGYADGDGGWCRGFILMTCGITSRADFAVNPEACAKLRDLAAEFQYRDTRR